MKGCRKDYQMKYKLLLVVGARPNFMKSAPLMKELSQNSDAFETILVHTGQHYDENLSKLFFDQLKMPQPDIFLGIGSGSHAEQTAGIMIALEKVFTERQPNLVIVFGDVNSTLAAAVVAAKLCIPTAHVEAGLRSFDNTMPEEINRIVTDRLSDYLFVTEKSGMVNLQNEGVPEDKMFFTGNIMIDSLVKNLEVSRDSDILERLSLEPKQYVTLTLHRPANVDNQAVFSDLLSILSEIGAENPVVFPCHPRTSKRLREFGLLENIDSRIIKIIDPLGYLDFLKLQSHSRFVLTDSGGVQEETTYLQIPCVTLRENTERPVTAEIGTNTITGLDPQKIKNAVNRILSGDQKDGQIPDLWDGQTAGRIVKVLLDKILIF